MTHPDIHPLAGMTVLLACHPHDVRYLYVGCPTPAAEFVVEDWYDRVTGRSWMVSDGSPAALEFAIRSGVLPGIHGGRIPTDNEVVYGHIGGLGFLIHADELATASVVDLPPRHRAYGPAPLATRDGAS